MGLFDFLSGGAKNTGTSGMVKAPASLNPQTDPYSESGGVVTKTILSRFPLPPRYLKFLAFNVDILRIAIQHLKNEIFITGIEIEEAYDVKCTNPDCEKKFEYTAKTCDVCGSEVTQPLWAERKNLEKIYSRINSLGQSLPEVIKEFEENLEIYDNGMLYVKQEYTINKTDGSIIGRIPQETMSVSPVNFEKNLSDTGIIGAALDGTPIRICLRHRESTTPSMTCKIDGCGWKTYPVEFTETFGKSRNHYIPGEIIHKTKYTSTKRMGYSPIYAIWKKLFALWYLDEQQMKQFQEGRPPKGFLVLNMGQSLLDSLIKKVKNILRENPNTIPFLAVEAQGKKMAEFINVSGTSSDQQLLEHRDAIRRMVAALYGVMPIFSGDISTGGGLNNESQQVVVTNDAVKRGQELLNSTMVELLSLYGIDGWLAVIQPNEEKDEMRELQIEQMKIQNAQVLQSMGFDISTNEQGEFEHSEKPVREPTGTKSGGFGESPLISKEKLFGEGNTIEKADKVYLKPGEKPPHGEPVHEGEKGGHYYFPSGSGTPSEKKPTTEKKKLSDLLKEAGVGFEDILSDNTEARKKLNLAFEQSGVKIQMGDSEDEMKEKNYARANLVLDTFPTEIKSAVNELKKAYSRDEVAAYRRGNNISFFLAGQLGTYIRFQTPERRIAFAEKLKGLLGGDVRETNKALKYIGIKERVKSSGIRQTAKVKTREEINNSLKEVTHGGVTYKISPTYIKNSKSFKNEAALKKTFDSVIDTLPPKAREVIQKGGTQVHFITRPEAKKITGATLSSRSLGYYVRNTNQVYIFPEKSDRIEYTINTSELSEAGYSAETIERLSSDANIESWKRTVTHELAHAVAYNEAGFSSMQSKYDEYIFSKYEAYQRREMLDDDFKTNYISGYAKTSPSEDFAETFAYYANYKKDVDELIEKDLIFGKMLKDKFIWMRDNLW